MKSRLSKGKYWIYGIGVSYFIMDQLFNQWLSYYYLPPKEETGLSPLLPAGLITLALVLSRFIDAVSDPLVGYLSDKTNSKWGKRTPFIALGGIPLGFTMVLFFFPVKMTTMTTFISLTIVGGLFFIFYKSIIYNAYKEPKVIDEALQVSIENEYSNSVYMTCSDAMMRNLPDTN